MNFNVHIIIIIIIIITYELLDTSGVEWYTLEGGRVITCVQTMVVVGNRYTINICAVGDRYRWSIIGNLQRLSPWRIATKRIIVCDSEFYLKKLND